LRPGTPQSVVIGDDADSDIAAARAAVLGGILVQTGKYREGDEAKTPRGCAVAEDVGAAVEEIRRQRGCCKDTKA
jgi:ribonucleotide monophosphatase NagD (HAD superfamily)